MELILDGNESRISFHILEVETRYDETQYELGALILIKIVDDGFCGSEDAWFEAAEWNAFVEQLRQCERTRRGSASLVHGALGELVRVESSDSAGHFVARYNITRGRGLSGDANATATLTGSFGLGSEFFGQRVRSFSPLTEWATRISEQNAAA